MGSKSRIAKHIAPIIQQYIDQSKNKVYIEPFVGGANVIDKIKAPHRLGFDINIYLIRLFQHLQHGGELPLEVSFEQYSAVRANKTAFPEWYVGCVGFLASYNGRFFDGGYSGIVRTKAGTVRNYYDEARRNIVKQSKKLHNVGFECWDYRQRTGKLGFSDCTIYCDPPYQNVKQYANSLTFDYVEF